MNRARQLTLLGLVVVVVAFAVTWLAVPTSLADVPLPASIFLPGLDPLRCVQPDYLSGDCRAYRPDATVGDLKERIVVVYGSAAAVVILVGLAFGAARRSTPIERTPSQPA